MACAGGIRRVHWPGQEMKFREEYRGGNCYLSFGALLGQRRQRDRRRLDLRASRHQITAGMRVAARARISQHDITTILRYSGLAWAVPRKYRIAEQEGECEVDCKQENGT